MKDSSTLLIIKALFPSSTFFAPLWYRSVPVSFPPQLCNTDVSLGYFRPGRVWATLPWAGVTETCEHQSISYMRQLSVHSGHWQ